MYRAPKLYAFVLTSTFSGQSVCYMEGSRLSNIFIVDRAVCEIPTHGEQPAVFQAFPCCNIVPAKSSRLAWRSVLLCAIRQASYSEHMEKFARNLQHLVAAEKL